MPSTYTGNPANVAPSIAPTETLPSDGDALAVASVNGPLQKLLDFIANIFKGPRVADGTVAAPAYSFISETGTGAYRAAAGDMRLAVGGTDALKLGAGGVVGPVNLPSTPTIAATGSSGQLLLQGNRNAAETGIDVSVGSTAGRTAGYIGAFQNPIGTTNRLLIDYQGLLTLGGQAAPIQPTSLWTSVTPGVGWGTSQTIAYWKDPFGVVHLKGAASFTSGTNPVFTLPAGFRPSLQKLFAAAGLGAATTPVAVVVNADGTVFINNTSAAAASGFLEGVTFLAEA